MASVQSRRHSQSQGNGSVSQPAPAGLRIDSLFCPPEIPDPFDTVQWELRSAAIKDESGEVLFEQPDCEIPASWSQLATNVVVSKYFYGENGTPEREQSVRQLIHRVTRTISDWGLEDGYFESAEESERFYRELTWLCLHQHGSFNSPVWFNVGLYHQYKVQGAKCNWHWDEQSKRAKQPENPYQYPQGSACFIQSVQDNMEDIMRLATSEAMLFKFGSGTGTDLSSIRSHREKLSGGGKPSGPLSFMRVYDQIAAVVKCVTADTYIYTADGIRQIGDIARGAPEGFSPVERLQVATFDGCSTASQLYVGRPSPVRKMTLRRTGLELTGTHEHPVLTLTSEFRLVWKALRDVEPGDRVAVDRSHAVWSRRAADLTGYHQPYGSGRGEAPKRQYKLPERMTTDLARLLGYLCAEGHVSDERIRFCNADRDVFDDFVRCFERSFGARVEQGISQRVNLKTGVATLEFCANWHYVARFLLQLGAGGKSAEKRIPQVVLDSPRQFVTEFLRGYFDGDGHVGRNIYASTASAELARQLQVVLLNYGIVAQRRRTLVAGQPHWRVLLCGANARLFVDHIGFVAERKCAVEVKESTGSNYDVVPGLVQHLRNQIHGRGYYRAAGGTMQRTRLAGLFSREGDVTYGNLQKRLEKVQGALAELDPEGLETLVFLLEKRFLWDEVLEIAEAGEAITYDLTVPGVHAFSTNGIVSHNSGGKTRRAAKMQSLKVWHPDILEFIECKWKEERKAHVLIEKGGYEANFNGEAYSSILFQNANLSVRVTDEFMEAVERGGRWKTRWVSQAANGAAPEFDARELLMRMAECAWHCGDPGVQYDTTINRWHTSPNSGRINASNPCVTGDTLVATDAGLRRIESLVGEQPQLLGNDGQYHQADRIWKTGRKQVYRLRTACGYELKLTGDHRVATRRGDVPASELTRHDELLLAPVGFGARTVSEFEADEIIDLLAQPVRMLSASAAGSAVALATPVEVLFDLSRESAALVIKRYYQRHKVKRAKFTGRAGLPTAFLFGARRETLAALQLLLLGFGIKSRVEDNLLAIVGDGADRFYQLIKGERLDESRAALSDSLAQLQPLGEEDVFDVAEPATHHFVANGIVVHNCSEYMFLDDTACNLASINLMKFRRADGTFDVERFQHACRIFFIAQEILVDHASYPTGRIATNSHLFRPLGLGYSNLGSLVMTSGLPYDSDAARGLCGSVTAILHGAANLASAEMAAVKGPFESYGANREPFLRVMQMHRDAVEEIDDAGPQYLKQASRQLWGQVLEQGREHGYRNAQATVLAPTGTISFMMDCDTTGIEPDIALVKYKQLAGGGMLKIINRTVPLGLRALGYDEPQIEAITRYVDSHDTIEGAPQLKQEHLPVFDCAFTPAGGVRSIMWKAHVRMMAAAQPFLSGAISKTVNMPADSTPQDIADAYLWGWKLGLKALAIYRDGSKQSQPLSTKSEASKAADKEKIVARPRRERLPDTRQSITHKFNVGGHEGYINVGLYPDGRPGELFITMAKEGSTVGGLMDSFGTAISMSLQYGVPLEVLVNKFSHTRFEPMGHTTNPDIRIAKSVVDYIFRWLGVTFLPGFREANNGLDYKAPEESAKKNHAASPAGPAATGGAASTAANGTSRALLEAALRPRQGSATDVDENGGPVTSRSDQFARFQSDAPSCDNCGAITVRNGNCYLCHNCGNSMGCS